MTTVSETVRCQAACVDTCEPTSGGVYMAPLRRVLEEKLTCEAETEHGDRVPDVCEPYAVASAMEDYVTERITRALILLLSEVDPKRVRNAVEAGE